MKNKTTMKDEIQVREPTPEELDIAARGIIALDAAAIERRDGRAPLKVGVKLIGKSGDFTAYRCNVHSCAQEGQYRGGQR